MADKTGIEWAQATWNPIVGCEHVSAGCDNCYAAREASGRLKHRPEYAGLAYGGKFTGEVRLLPERLDQPLRWKRPRRIFVNSMSDLFHKDVPDDYIAQVFAVMAAAPQHTFQVLTKRHGRMRAILSSPQFPERVKAHAEVALTWPLPNAWIGVSVEDASTLFRVDGLRTVPAAVRFLSCEPLLGPLDGLDLHGIGWVIAGGESGREARPMHPDWVRSLRDQCVAAGVPFLLKQHGEFVPTMPGCGCPERYRDAAWQVGDEFWPVWRVGKKAAGRELDGREWDEYPQAVSR